jgi:uncharacterized membrane protein
MIDSSFDKRLQNLKRIIIGFAIVTIGVYIVRFYKFRFSTDPGDWGVFGDYVGGVLNPLVSFASLLVTYYVAEMVNSFAKGENERQVLIQRKVIKSQLMYDSLKDFRVEINRHFEKVFDSTINIDMFKYNIRQAISCVEEFHQNYNHLFDANPMFQSRLVSEMRTAIGTIDSLISAGRPIDRTEIIGQLVNSKNGMISTLNKEIVWKLEER